MLVLLMALIMTVIAWLFGRRVKFRTLQMRYTSLERWLALTFVGEEDCCRSVDPMAMAIVTTTGLRLGAAFS